jgi:hypothetical protein
MPNFTHRLGYVAFAAYVSIFASGCSSDKSSGPPVDPDMLPYCELPAPCKQIAQACMPKDDTLNAAVHACHMTGMGEGNNADCAKDLVDCLATCNAAPPLSDDPPEDLNAACVDGGSAEAGAPGVSFPATALSTFEDAKSTLQIELRTAPQQPIQVGPEGAGQLTIHDAATGAPVDGLEISVSTYMPVMQHSCSAVSVKVVPQGEGVYLMSPLLASMKGDCELRLSITGARTLSVTSPTFEIIK